MVQIFKVLSDPTRFKAFQLLMNQSMYVQELARAVEVTPATLIHHIDQLMNAGLIRLSARQEDQKRIYYIAHREAFQEVVAQLERMSVHEE
jgi:DNA-binding transcriptional ArsR family regulator